MDKIYKKISLYSNISLILFILSLFDITLVVNNPNQLKIVFLFNILIFLLPFLSIFIVKHNIKKTNNPTLLKGSKILTIITIIKIIIVIIYLLLTLVVNKYLDTNLQQSWWKKWLTFAISITLNFICVILYIWAMIIIKIGVKRK